MKNWRQILSYEEPPLDPVNPNKEAIEALKNILLPDGVAIDEYSDLMEFLLQHNILVPDPIVDAIESLSSWDRFSGYLVFYRPVYQSRSYTSNKVYLEICGMLAPMEGQEVGSCTSPLRIY